MLFAVRFGHGQTNYLYGQTWRQESNYVYVIIDVEFASGYRILILVFATHRCVLALYFQYFPESCEQISQACYSGGIRTNDPCNSRAVSYQLDYRGCPVARGSSNPMFWQRDHNDIIDVKFALGMKNINSGFLPIHRCVLALYTQ